VVCDPVTRWRDLTYHTRESLPNKRLRLAGGDRLKGPGVFVPWRARTVRPLLLRRRASRPQLKRDPLGGLTIPVRVMPITRINEFQAKPDKAVALRDFLRSVIARIIDAPGCRACELLVQRDDQSRLAIIEVWDSVEAHRASVSRIPPDLLQQAQTLFAVPARGAYYDPVSEEAA